MTYGAGLVYKKIVTRKPEELHQCFCSNNEKLSWDETFDSLLEFQNSNSAQAVHK